IIVILSIFSKPFGNIFYPSELCFRQAAPLGSNRTDAALRPTLPGQMLPEGARLPETENK
ncbi:MAG: hypothetical protein J6N50_02900, partial [Bacteroidales bacterium]|nr:hypothetical protein [Bacteroidales bacterium]